MLAVSESITESIKQIIQSLQIRFLFPAIVFFFVNSLIIPNNFKDKIRIDDSYVIIINVIIIILISYLLNAFNGVIIRLAEGYVMRWIYIYKKENQEKEYTYLTKKINKCKEKISSVTDIKDELRNDNKLTPSLEKEIDRLEKEWQIKMSSLVAEKKFRFSSQGCLPTQIGNTIAAFENYSKERYGMDAVYLWPRMLPNIEDKFLTLVQNERSSLDFLLNTGLICIIIFIESVSLFIFNFGHHLFIISIIALAFSWLFYYAANSVAKDWGVMVCAAFDLYRENLRKALHLHKLHDNDLDKEKEVWEEISRLIIYGMKSGNFNGFFYSETQEQNIVGSNL